MKRLLALLLQGAAVFQANGRLVRTTGDFSRQTKSATVTTAHGKMHGASPKSGTPPTWDGGAAEIKQGNLVQESDVAFDPDPASPSLMIDEAPHNPYDGDVQRLLGDTLNKDLADLWGPPSIQVMGKTADDSEDLADLWGPPSIQVMGKTADDSEELHELSPDAALALLPDALGKELQSSDNRSGITLSASDQEARSIPSILLRGLGGEVSQRTREMLDEEAKKGDTVDAGGGPSKEAQKGDTVAAGGGPSKVKTPKALDRVDSAWEPGPIQAPKAAYNPKWKRTDQSNDEIQEAVQDDPLVDPFGYVFARCGSIQQFREFHSMESADLTVPVCDLFCKAWGKTVYFGVTHGTTCWCADNFILNFAENPACDITCPGNQKETCGGKRSSSIYISSKVKC